LCGLLVGAQAGRLLGGSNTSFDLACSLRGSWNLRMSEPVEATNGVAEEGEDTTAGESVLGFALLAFDRDEDVATSYRILELPSRGTLFAATAVTGQSFTSSEQRAFMEIGGVFFQVSNDTRTPYPNQIVRPRRCL
jgi:hypothetical protein